MNITLIIALSVIGAGVLIAIILKIISMMKGKIEINLNNFNFSQGESITGKVILKLKKPVEAKSLKIGLIAESSSKTRITAGNSDPVNSNSQKSILFNFSQPLDGEKTYPAGQTEYDFSINIPRNASPSSTGNAVADSVIKTAQIVSNLSNPRWYVIAELEVAGFNLSRRVQVNIA
ncbi:MAG: hypothetical protein GYA14_03825 [Ignavibacteria bacterium]|nr:hypothetical protein [Ignavibacteria bacterium]